MLLCLVMVSLTTIAQTRGGGEDEEIFLEFNISKDGQILNTGQPHTWSYPVEMSDTPFWVSYNSEDANKFETLCLRIEENRTLVQREARFTLVAYHPAGTTTGRTVYIVHIIQAAR